MATIYITEYERQAFDGASQLTPVPLEVPLANQTVAIGGASVQSSAFNARTALVRLATDTACHVEVGVNPTATATTRFLPANFVEYIGVPQGGAFKVAVIA